MSDLCNAAVAYARLARHPTLRVGELQGQSGTTTSLTASLGQPAVPMHILLNCLAHTCSSLHGVPYWLAGVHGIRLHGQATGTSSSAQPWTSSPTAAISRNIQRYALLFRFWHVDP